ncbi:hypothetical protein V6N13_012034 [Hibiscus sabdariffa]|uniref:Uncharacterized protein n=1 Tax=Hibiscus sabdariffa TaxID=183260 RepID=A0ABR2SE50_9ROSI
MSPSNKHQENSCKTTTLPTSEPGDLSYESSKVGDNSPHLKNSRRSDKRAKTNAYSCRPTREKRATSEHGTKDRLATSTARQQRQPQRK